ncbi:hypothetical protein [Streptomyces fradiae]|uniref:Uncharacterized protein n=1 Tax=Streptomyces fradiae ATCC 10745 = DSM 40063 TaxID=1319510 RepID=A0ABQ6XTV1_STRFR|nr:hypothetical protein [Streptomyces fradiae]KAF0649189.1 hypothetical protein K701_13855 [Streptomyces fradiae ATCC 10745 = DSM 40063]
MTQPTRPVAPPLGPPAPPGTPDLPPWRRAAEPAPAAEGPDWLDQLWDATTKDFTPTPQPEPDPDDDTHDEPDHTPPPPPWFTPQPAYWPTPPALPKPSLSDGTKRFLSNVGAGAAGYAVGLTPTLGSLIAECGQTYSISAALILGGGICGIAAFWDRRTRHWYRPLAWAARIPLASAITALALYAPAAHP